jgi:arsenate reductase
MMIVYGLKNCDTCRSAIKWLKAEGIDHIFQDFRKDGLNANSIRCWLEAVGSDTLLNRRGTTWRKLDEVQKQFNSDQELINLLQEYPALIKRPVFENGTSVIVGFKDEQKTALKD